MSKAKEGYLIKNTLSCVVKLCVGREATIELRNDSFVTGYVVAVDGFMNVTLSKVLFCDPCGNRRKFDEFFLQNRLIRYVQIPKTIDMKSALINALAPPKRGKHTPKVSRARESILKKRELRRLEDIENAAKMKSNP